LRCGPAHFQIFSTHDVFAPAAALRTLFISSQNTHEEMIEFRRDNDAVHLTRDLKRHCKRGRFIGGI
jgi:hypothetical protein